MAPITYPVVISQRSLFGEWRNPFGSSNVCPYFRSSRNNTLSYITTAKRISSLHPAEGRDFAAK
jgi:hypothetical protein